MTNFWFPGRRAILNQKCIDLTEVDIAAVSVSYYDSRNLEKDFEWIFYDLTVSGGGGCFGSMWILCTRKWYLHGAANTVTKCILEFPRSILTASVDVWSF